LIYKLRHLTTGVPHLILPGVHIVGRSPDLDVVLDDDSISRRHACFENGEHGLILEDLQSSNGTFLHGKRMTSPQCLSLGDEVRFGGVRFRIDPEVGDAGGRAEVVAARVVLAPETVQRKTHKVQENDLHTARAAAVQANAWVAPAGKYPGSSLFQSPVGLTPSHAAPAPQPPSPRWSRAWFMFLTGFVVGLSLGGLLVAWWMHE
jgi:hypothetical protein